MALCRETRESIHQIIRISNSSNFYNNKMDCTSWWWRKSDYRIPNDLTKGWNWDRKGWYHRSWDDKLLVSWFGEKYQLHGETFSRNFVFEGDPIVRTIKTKFEGEESQVILLLSTLHQSFCCKLRFVPVLTMLSACRMIRFLILSVCLLLSEFTYVWRSIIINKPHVNMSENSRQPTRLHSVNATCFIKYCLPFTMPCYGWAVVTWLRSSSHLLSL